MDDMELAQYHIVLDALPDYVAQAVAERRALRDALRAADSGYEFVVSDVDSWGTGARVRVAFRGGSTALLERIEGVLLEISGACGITFDTRDEGNAFRTWSPEDEEYAGEIRVGFGLNGYFSLVGKDSVDPWIGSTGGAVGGNPGQQSLNLGGFDRWLPDTWRGTTIHEFLHAIGFHHEHQNLEGPCQTDFRWEDDPGYVRTTDARGVFVADSAGRRPGIYTYLSGPPNRWDKAKIDFNLRADATASLRYGPFDRASVMLYRFPDSFYTAATSECRPSGDGQGLSQGDVTALRSLYPVSEPDVQAVEARREDLARRIEAVEAREAERGLESGGRRRWAGRVR